MNDDDEICSVFLILKTLICFFLLYFTLTNEEICLKINVNDKCIK